MSESPVKRYPKQQQSANKNAAAGAVIGRLGNFVLMVDGKGVGGSSKKGINNSSKITQNETQQQIQRSSTNVVGKGNEMMKRKKTSKEKEQNHVLNFNTGIPLSESIMVNEQQEEQSPQKRF